MKKQYVYMNNHFAAQAVADARCCATCSTSRSTAPMPAELVSRYPMLEGKVATLPPFTVALMMRSPTASFCTTSMPVMTLPKTGVLAVEVAGRAE